MAEDSRPPLTSIILPAYVPNKELSAVTKRCLRSLSKTTERLSYELIIVDNGSYPAAAKWLREKASVAFGDSYLRYGSPIGYARAANIGLAVAQHDWLVVLNTDIEFRGAGWLEQLQADYPETPGGILAAMDDGREGIVYDESWFSCWLTHRDVIRKVGYFDETLSYRFHDQDYAIRVKQAGCEVMRDGNVQVKHIDSATYDTMNRGNDRAEEQEMIRRWDARDFDEWLRVTA